MNLSETVASLIDEIEYELSSSSLPPTITMTREEARAIMAVDDTFVGINGEATGQLAELKKELRP